MDSCGHIEDPSKYIHKKLQLAYTPEMRTYLDKVYLGDSIIPNIEVSFKWHSLFNLTEKKYHGWLFRSETSLKTVVSIAGNS